MHLLLFSFFKAKVLLLSIVILVVLCACEEKYNHHDPKLFNAQLAVDRSLDTPEDLIRHYYQVAGDEDESPKLTVTTEALDKTKYSITLIHDYLTDDSQKAKKIILIASKANGLWTVHNIKTNFKCWPNRGHQRWGIAPCQ